jgi:hypothetical protein
MTGNNSPNWRLAGWILLAVFNCAVIIPWLSTLAPHPRDFDAFYMAAEVYQHNPGHLLYDLHLQLRAEQQMYAIDDAHASKYFLPFNHLPYELILWLPMTALPFRLAFWVWRLESVGLLAIASWLLAKTLESRRPAKVVFLISLAFFPVPNSLMTGQDTFVTLVLFALSLWFLKTGRNVYAGMVLGLCLFKLQLVLPIIGVLLLCGCWRVIAGFASSGSIVLAISTAMVGYDGMTSLLQLWLKGESGTLLCIKPTLMPNIRGLLTAISGLPPHWVTIATVIVSFLLLLLAAQQARIAQSPERLFAICVCFVALVSFHTNIYDLSILILPILLLLDTPSPSSTRPRWIAMPPVALLFCTPSYLLVAATSKIGLLAIIVGWLWYAVSYGIREQATKAVLGASNVSELAVAHD